MGNFRTRGVPISIASSACWEAEQITSLLVEGGAAVNWACLRARLVDKLMLFYTPRIFGPVGAVPWLTGDSGSTVGRNLGATHIAIERFGEDFRRRSLSA